MQFAPRPTGFQCPYASNIQSYCDAADPYCCNGSDANTHQGYATEYGSVALTFVKGKLNAAISGTGGSSSSSSSTSVSSSSHSTTSSSSAPPSGATAAHWGQCGGNGWTGPTVCASGYTCQCSNACTFIPSSSFLAFTDKPSLRQTTASACKIFDAPLRSTIPFHTRTFYCFAIYTCTVVLGAVYSQASRKQSYTIHAASSFF